MERLTNLSKIYKLVELILFQSTFSIQMDGKVSGIFSNVAERRGLENSTRFRLKQEKPTVLTVLNVKVKRDY